ncbi:MAG: MogA/MoaB family molybdenum cofactor biosynthesis protein [Acidimicrobiia bacterium]|nr:MogA/MoaB family molybdenum cofactor biosynthesis protein [Acidimicrobiia bacterium]MXX44711.1 MogA/MoaB family molybdenum cofactor biosynthesis protein [Acidimicrobiia bacterium]MYB79049.1 MogA/MoaB family molybdenum cofactor biosynthesis protein [Acidimicrobiia bacterium]
MARDTAWRAAVITLSDGVIAGTRQDRSGEVLSGMLAEAGYEIRVRKAVEDTEDLIVTALLEACDEVDLVVTTGGTGLGPRDVTPEATRRVIDREVPGLSQMMMAAGLAVTPMAALSRAVVGARGSALIINLPGSPKGAVENLEPVLGVLPHALDLLAGDTVH